MKFSDSLPLSADDVAAAVKNSGYPFELEAARRIEAAGFFVTPNYNFEDHDTGQSREIDIHALGAESVASKRLEFVFPVVVAACKANANPYVFFTRDNVLSGIQLSVDRPLSGAPLEIIDSSGDSIEAEEFFHLENVLHVSRAERISSQFCEIERRDGTWRVSQSPLMQNIVIPLIKSLDREIADHNGNFAEIEEDYDISNYQLYFPALVVRGPVFEYYLPSDGDGAQVNPVQHVVVVRHYQSTSVKGEFAFDIHESYLERFLGMVESETLAFVRRIRRHRQSVIRSLEAMRAAQREEDVREARGKARRPL